MKKFLRFYLPIFIILLSLGLMFLIYMFKNHQVLIAYSVGRARLYSNEPLSAVVKVSGKEINAKVFKRGDNEFLVFAPDNKENQSVIIVDKSKNDIGLTNAFENCYELLFDKYLFQDDKAQAVVYASSSKWDYNPNLVITDSRISYTTQKRIDGKLVDIPVDIFFKGE